MLLLIETADGSHTIKNEELNETYHSIHGAIQESNHVFIKNGLHYYIEQMQPKAISILEVGFGTGLNALLTCLDPKTSGIAITYDAVEAFPLPIDVTEQLNYPSCLGKPEAQTLMNRMHETPWNKKSRLTRDFILHKINSELQSLAMEDESYDIVYFDAFAPSKQPELWKLEVLSPVIWAIKEGGILVTYCARGQFKRDLKSLNMDVKSLSGPPGKLEMVRATCHNFK